MLKDIETHVCRFTTDKQTNKIIDIYYGKDTANRKIALREPPKLPTVFQEPNKLFNVNNFLTYEIPLYQRDNILRKLPSFIDGLVSSRRKVLSAARAYGRSDLKVNELSAITTQKFGYKHGESSLNSVTIGMASNGIDSNSLPLLLAKGNFGSRSGGYSNFSSPRYLSTALNAPLVDKLFRQEDDYLLHYELDEGSYFEAISLAPVIPYVLTEYTAIPGTGWKIILHPRNIADIFTNVRNLIFDKQMIPLRMHHRGFKGKVVTVDKKQYFIGTYKVSGNTVTITELPPQIFLNSYLGIIEEKKDYKKDKKTEKKVVKKVIDKKIPDKMKTGGILTKYGNDLESYSAIIHNQKDVEIKLNFKPKALARILENTTLKHDAWDIYVEAFNLKEPITHNLNLVDEKGNVCEFTNYEDIMSEWFKKRKALYTMRVQLERIINKYQVEILEAKNKFSMEGEKLGLTGQKSLQIFIDILEKNKYKKFNTSILNNPKFMMPEELIKNITETDVSYDYLLDMNSKHRSQEKVLEREKEINKLIERRKLLVNDGKLFDGANLWIAELKELEDTINANIDIGWNAAENDVISCTKEEFEKMLSEKEEKKASKVVKTVVKKVVKK